MSFDKEKFIEHLQGMIRIPTISSADPEQLDKEAYFRLHEYLKETYPLIHANLTREVVSRASLLYHWKGTGKSEKLPLLLAAHQDVVPEGDHSQWLHPPYSGDVADKSIWGRGSGDSKSNILSYMEAIEYLLQQGFVPDYDIYLAFGHNEEIMGGPEPGAGAIAALLKSWGIKLGCVIDECGGTFNGEEKGLSGLITQIYVAEKGYADYEISAVNEGGHSSRPGITNALVEVCKALIKISENARPYRLIPPVVNELRLQAERWKKEDADFVKLLKDPEENWDKLLPILKQTPEYSALLHTTTAITMAKGSDQANILPERASAVVNCRLLNGDTLEDLQEYFEKIVPEGVNVNLLKGHNPPPVAAVNALGYRLIKEISEETYPGTLVIPSYLLGGTDSRWYFDICESNSVYRFSGYYQDSKSGNAHRVNEKLSEEKITTGAEFFLSFIQRYSDFI